MSRCVDSVMNNQVHLATLKKIVTPSLVLIVSLFSVALILVSPVW